MRPAVLIPLLAAVVVPASAHAAPVIDVELERSTVQYGAEHELTGTLLDGAAPLAGQEVVLEGRRYPYKGSYRVVDRATTDDEGAFEFEPELDRNHRLRVTAPAHGLTSEVVHAYTLPAFELSFRALRPGVVRLYQRYKVPRSVRLSSPTRFYLGRRGAKRASVRETGKVERTKRGRYTSQVTVTLPERWKGEFRYASCFRPSPKTGMGDPRAKCPKLRLKF